MKREEILHKQKTARNSGLFCLILNQRVLELMLSKN
jgi:hypothetical protein